MTSPIIIALDFNNRKDAERFVKPLSPDMCKLKVGFELFIVAGRDFVQNLVARGFDVFLDLKFHDIPNTVAAACRAAAELGVWMINVHASGGTNMLHTAKEALSKVSKPPKLIAVTVLTSMDEQQLNGIGIQQKPKEHVLHLAKLAHQCELDGLVCSAQEAELLRKHYSQDFLLVTPGIRPVGSKAGDQKRVMTPEQAILSGVNYLVIGRPITQASNPIKALEKINTSIQVLDFWEEK